MYLFLKDILLLGISTIGRLIRKSPRERKQISFVSDDTEVNDLEISNGLIRINNLDNSLKVKI